MKNSILKLLALILVLFCVSFSDSVKTLSDAHIPIKFLPDSIIYLIYNYGPDITSAKSRMLAAEYNFMLFDAQDEQLTPFVSSTYGKTNYYYNNLPESEAGTSVGLNKNFSNGAYISSSVGTGAKYKKSFTDPNINVNQYFELPLFTSRKKLERTINRAYQESELYRTRNDYINAIKDNIRWGLYNYYGYIIHLKILEGAQKKLLQLDSLESQGASFLTADQKQFIESEKTVTKNDIITKNINLNSIKNDLQNIVCSVPIKDVPFEELNYGLSDTMSFYGKEYLSTPVDSLVSMALINNQGMSLLLQEKANTTEKLRLAELGKWDVFLNGNLKHSYLIDSDNPNATEGSIGLNVKLMDKTVLKYSELKAREELERINTDIEKTRQRIKMRIANIIEQTKNQRTLILSSYSSLLLREDVLKNKCKNCLIKKETLENTMTSITEYRQTWDDCYWQVNEYLGLLRNLEYECGIYFQKLPDVMKNLVK